MENKRYDAVIVGGGVIGCSIAFQLAKRGASVIVLEKQEIAQGASRAAAGMLGAQSEFTTDSPLIPLALKSREIFPSIVEELEELTGIDIGLVQRGLIKVACSKEDGVALEQHYQFWKQQDPSVQWLSMKELQEREPHVTETLYGAMYLPGDGQVRAADLSIAFAKAASRFGAVIKEYTEVYSLLWERGQVKGVETAEGRITSDNVILCAGAWSKQLLKPTGIDVPIFPVKGECLSVVTEIPFITSTIFANNGCYIVPKKGNRLVIGATSQEGTFHQKVSVKGVQSLLERASAILPSIVEAHWENVWSGIRPQTSDGLPYLGEHPDIKGLFGAFGHYRNGILLSPITGVIIADLVEGKTYESIDLSSFHLLRVVPTSM
jgi:glycine oxidase